MVETNKRGEEGEGEGEERRGGDRKREAGLE